MNEYAFGPKTLSVLYYLHDHLKDSTYWCEDMMQMLVYLADRNSILEYGESISSIDWSLDYTDKKLEAINMPSKHWEEAIQDTGMFSRLRRKINGYSNLTEREERVLSQIVEMKLKDKYRIGSLMIRENIFEKLSYNVQVPRIYDNVVQLPLRNLNRNHTDLMWKNPLSAPPARREI